MGKKHRGTKEKGKDGKDKAEKPVAVTAEPASPALAAEPSQPQQDRKAPETAPGALGARQITLISKALADPTRMAVLRAIAKGGATCSGMRDCAGVSAATLSHHMKELESAGLIETERKGRFVEPKFQRKVWKKYIEELKSLSK